MVKKVKDATSDLKLFGDIEDMILAQLNSTKMLVKLDEVLFKVFSFGCPGKAGSISKDILVERLEKLIVNVKMIDDSEQDEYQATTDSSEEEDW